jgi:hypothetical protein
MTKYMKKPVIVDAVQYTGTNKKEILDFTDGRVLITDITQNTIKVETRRGAVITFPGDYIVKGDYIIKGHCGDLIVLKSKHFENTYIPAE